MILTYYIIPILRKSFLDKPNQRSSHTKATPTGGGIIFVLLSIISSIRFNFFLPLICLPLSITGFIDDRYHLSANKRFTIQIITGTCIILTSILFNSYIPIISKYILIIFLILLIMSTFLINSINFIDGLDGLLSSCMITILTTISFVYFPEVLPIVGALIGFIIFNWSPSKIFMGDGGSTFLGALFVGLILKVDNIADAISILLLSTPLILDTGICVLRRLVNRQPLTKAHKLHLFQRLNQSGWPHSKVSLTYFSATLLLCAGLLTKNIFIQIIFALLVIILGIILEKFALPFKEALDYEKNNIRKI